MHFLAATYAPSRIAAGSAIPVATPKQNDPMKESPAPVVSAICSTRMAAAGANVTRTGPSFVAASLPASIRYTVADVAGTAGRGTAAASPSPSPSPLVAFSVSFAFASASSDATSSRSVVSSHASSQSSTLATITAPRLPSVVTSVFARGSSASIATIAVSVVSSPVASRGYPALVHTWSPSRRSVSRLSLSRSPSTSTGTPISRALRATLMATSVRRPSKYASEAPVNTAATASSSSSSSAKSGPGVWMHVRVAPARSTMMYVNGELAPLSMTIALVSTPSASNSSTMALPAPSSESFVRMRGRHPRREVAVSAFPQLPPPCTSNESVRSFASGSGNAAMDAR